MKKRFLASLLLLLLLTNISYGQDVDWEKFEVGIDLLWLIKKNNIPPSFFIKKIDLKQRKHDFGFIRRGYRLRFGGSYEQPNERTQTNGYSSFRPSTYSIVFRPGYEWHKQIKSFDIFYGFDIATQFNGSKIENTVAYVNTDTGEIYSLLYTQRNRYARIGLSPILGTTIKIYKNISLTMESTIDIYYSNRTSSYSGDYEDFCVTGNGFGISTYPLYTLNASFSF